MSPVVISAHPTKVGRLSQRGLIKFNHTKAPAEAAMYNCGWPQMTCLLWREQPRITWPLQLKYALWRLNIFDSNVAGGTKL